MALIINHEANERVRAIVVMDKVVQASFLPLVFHSSTSSGFQYFNHVLFLFEVFDFVVFWVGIVIEAMTKYHLVNAVVKVGEENIRKADKCQFET
ncbi:hypothetical protein QWY93_15685 [Echinicola jeungdonensis]|uniref:Uncharacterized protein n=1 Tax=Echinicola jeungdonensis TaxID=709343 RepID=A0ABV5J707_9BACT|nr:hypothetical protein [Echinicola jeungdonensis]MDN3670765.1 hypothetical protein [Echinicola jeungdonensis]